MRIEVLPLNHVRLPALSVSTGDARAQSVPQLKSLRHAAVRASSV